MSISDAQQTANRENAQKSTGPKTESGKTTSAINAVRHGLTGQFHAFSEEDQIAYEVHCNGLLADFNPQSYLEMTLAISIAEDHWRLHRARAIENNIFAMSLSGSIGEATVGNTPEVHTACVQARTWMKESNNLQLLTLYESRIRRTIEKNVKQLTELKAERNRALDLAIEKAKILTQMAAVNGETYDVAADFPELLPPPENPEPAKKRLHIWKEKFKPGNWSTSANGFVFSNDEISRRLDFDKRVTAAIVLSRNGWQLPKPHRTADAGMPKAA
jgi:hypothetical protein